MPAVTMTSYILIVALEGKKPEIEHDGKEKTKIKKGKQDRKRKKRECTIEEKIERKHNRKKREGAKEKDT
jgi:hypothetical protein